MYKPIVATLGYVISPDGKETLLVHRNRRLHDHHLGKYNGLGGKLRPDEDVQTCLLREIREEAGVECEMVELRGTVNWTGFGPKGENWLGFIFLVKKYSGWLYEVNDEGDLGWHLIHSLDKLPMWEGDRHFLPLVFDGDPRLFHGHMPYKNNRPVGWHYTRM
jgi:8-oxo-dGTP diphosphatase